MTATRNEGTYEDVHIRSLTANTQSQSCAQEEDQKGIFKDSEDHYSCTNGVAAGNSPNMGKARGLRLNHPFAPETFPMKDSLQSNSEENLRMDSNETSDTDLTSSPLRGVRHAWSSQRRESDFSTAPFSSETSDMDTSGNERTFTDGGSMSDLTCSKSDQVDPNLSPCASNSTAAGSHLEYIPAATHLEKIPAVPNLGNISGVPNLENGAHLENIPAVTVSGSNQRTPIGGISGDKMPKRRSSAKPPVSRKPPAILPGTGANKLTPPSPKKPLHASKSNPIPTGEKAKGTSPQQQSVTHPKVTRSGAPPIPKPKPPSTAKPPKPMLRPKPTHLNSPEVALKGKHATPRQSSVDSTPENDNSGSRVAPGNYQKISYMKRAQSELTPKTTHVESERRRMEHFRKTQSETDTSGAKKSPRLSAAPPVRNLTKIIDEEELGDAGHINCTSSTKPAVPMRPKQQGAEKRLQNAKQTFSTETIELRETSTSCTDSSKSLSSSEATSGHSQSPNVSPSSSPAVRKKPLPPQKPSVLPKKPGFMHQSVSASAILQSEEEKNQASKPANRLDSSVMSLDSALMSSVTQRAGKTPQFSLPATVTEQSSPPSTTPPSDQSAIDNEKLPVIRQATISMATTVPSTDEQGPPLPPRKSNRRSTHIELVIPGEDVPPELPPRKPRLSSPRRPPPSPPTQRRAGGEKRSTIARANNVGHSGHPSAEPKRHSMFSSNLTTSQIDSISENYEVWEFNEDEGFTGSADEASPPQQASKKPVKFKIQGFDQRASPDLIGQSTDSKKGSDNEQERDSPSQLHRNGGSAKKRPPPKPPKYPSFEEAVPLTQSSVRLTPPSLRQKAADPTHSPLACTPSDHSQDDTPPPLPTQPIPKKKDRYGSKKQNTSVTYLDRQRSSSRSPPPPQPPKMEDTCTANKSAMTRNEPIYDVIQDVPRVDPYDTVVLVSKSKQDKDKSLPQKNKSVFRKEKSESGSPELPHFGTHTKSNSVSLMYRRATSDRFKHRVSTLDPDVLESLSKDISLRRTSSLDRLNDRMDHSSSVLTDSSSEDEEVGVVSPIQQG